MAAPSLRMCSHVTRNFLGFNVNHTERILTSVHRRLLSTPTAESNTSKEEASVPGNEERTDGQSGVNEALLQAEKAFKEEKDKLSNEIKETQDKYKRSLAETENVRQRMKKQIDDAKLFGIQGFCKDLLEVADILGKATDSVPKDQISDSNPHLKSLFEGLTMTETELQKVFTRNGVTQINPDIGEKFNPNIHEALFQVTLTEGKEVGTVAAVTKSGYSLHNRTLRPALVGVFKEA